MLEVELYNPEIQEIPGSIEIVQSFQWITPGTYLAQRIFDDPLVRFVGERYENDYLQIVVVLSNDPEDLLNRVFEIEQKIYEKFNKLRIDIRVRVVLPEDSIDLIKNSSVMHFER